MLAKSADNITKLLTLMIAHEENMRNYYRNNIDIQFVFSGLSSGLSGIESLDPSQNTDVSQNTENVSYTTYVNLINHNETVCPITQDAFDSDDPVALLECGHYFKQEPFRRWSRRNRTCPVCRQRFR